MSALPLSTPATPTPVTPAPPAPKAVAPCTTAQLLSTQEAAKMLGIGMTNLYRLMNSGQLPSVKIGKRRLIPQRELERYVDRLMLRQAHRRG